MGQGRVSHVPRLKGPATTAPPGLLTRQAEPRLVQVAHRGHWDLPRAGRARLGAAPGLGGYHHLVDRPVIEASGHTMDLGQLQDQGAGCEGAEIPAHSAL